MISVSMIKINITNEVTFINSLISWSYVDPESATVKLDFYIYNITDNSEIYHATSINHSIANFVYIVSDANTSSQPRHWNSFLFLITNIPPQAGQLVFIGLFHDVKSQFG